MLRRGIHRIALALVLAAALLAPAASLAAGPSASAPTSPWRLDLDALWAWAHFWLGIPGALCKEAAGASSDGGLHIDPNGLQTSSPPAGASSDGGAHIDPNGLQTTGSNSDGGLQIDPNG